MTRIQTLLFAFPCLLACGPVFYDDAVRAVARDQMHCSPNEIAIEDVGSYQYRAVGCGQRAKYACTSGHASPVCVRMGPMEGASEPAIATGESLQEPSQESQSSAPNPELEGAVRAFLDAHHTDVLACVGREVIAIRASWPPGSQAQFTLVGALAGTAEERCVATALIGFPTPPNSSYESVLLVRAAPEIGH